jgi:hypothetical protein
MSPIEIAIRDFSRKLRKVQQDRSAPFVLSDEIDGYLDTLKQKHPEDHSDFVLFLYGLSVDALRDELAKQIRPESDREAFTELRAQLQSLRAAKESAILKNNFESAAHCHERIKEIEDTMQGFAKSHTLLVSPELLEKVLTNLGYQG